MGDIQVTDSKSLAIKDIQDSVRRAREEYEIMKDPYGLIRRVYNRIREPMWLDMLSPRVYEPLPDSEPIPYIPPLENPVTLVCSIRIYQKKSLWKEAYRIATDTFPRTSLLLDVIWRKRPVEELIPWVKKAGKYIVQPWISGSEILSESYANSRYWQEYKYALIMEANVMCMELYRKNRPVLEGSYGLFTSNPEPYIGSISIENEGYVALIEPTWYRRFSDMWVMCDPVWRMVESHVGVESLLPLTSKQGQLVMMDVYRKAYIPYNHRASNTNEESMWTKVQYAEQKRITKNIVCDLSKKINQQILQTMLIPKQAMSTPKFVSSSGVVFNTRAEAIAEMNTREAQAASPNTN